MRGREDLTPYYEDETTTIYLADNREALPALPSGSVDMVFTSPPYNLGNSSGGNFPGKSGHYKEGARLGARGGCGKWSGGALANGYGEHDDRMPHPEYVEWQNDFLRACWPLLTPAGAIYYNHKPRILSGQLVAPMDYVPADLRPYVRQEIIWARARRNRKGRLR